MGNKLGRRRQVVDERFTRPQGLYVNKDVDIKKLRKLILESKLAPCFPGEEECCNDREECPICFLYYPSLNRSRCCMKSICTECFLQMKNPNSARPTQCPFCKTSNYAVEYRGVKTKEEKGMEQIEEQRVIEAKIRMRQKELQDEEERMQKRLESCSSSTSAVTAEMEYGSAAAPSHNSPAEDGEIVSCQDACAASTVRQPVRPRGNRDDEFDVDLEDIMVMEAIWLSIQETGMQKNTAYGEVTSSGQYVSEDRYVSPSMAPVVGSSSSSPSGGLACAIAALAERQQMIGESSNDNNHSINASSYNILPGSSTSCYDEIDQDADDDTYPIAEATIHGSVDTAEAGTSYASSDVTEDSGSEISREVSGSFRNLTPPPPPPPLIVPESFEEQMMLAMAVSLAEVRATTSAPAGVTWQ